MSILHPTSYLPPEVATTVVVMLVPYYYTSFRPKMDDIMMEDTVERSETVVVMVGMNDELIIL
jgi:hypothetical protein